jgi:hypothetical protein
MAFNGAGIFPPISYPSRLNAPATFQHRASRPSAARNSGGIRSLQTPQAYAQRGWK